MSKLRYLTFYFSEMSCFGPCLCKRDIGGSILYGYVYQMYHIPTFYTLRSMLCSPPCIWWTPSYCAACPQYSSCMLHLAFWVYVQLIRERELYVCWSTRGRMILDHAMQYKHCQYGECHFPGLTTWEIKTVLNGVYTKSVRVWEAVLVSEDRTGQDSEDLEKQV